MKVFGIFSILAISFLFNNAISQIYDASYNGVDYKIYRQGEVGAAELYDEPVFEMTLSNYLRPSNYEQKKHKDLIAIGNEYDYSKTDCAYTCIFFYEKDQPTIDVEFTDGKGVQKARAEDKKLREEREKNSYKLKKGVDFLKSANRTVCFKSITDPVNLYDPNFKKYGPFYRYTPLFEPKAHLRQRVMFHGQPVICENEEPCRKYINENIKILRKEDKENNVIWKAAQKKFKKDKAKAKADAKTTNKPPVKVEIDYNPVESASQM